MWSFVYGKCRYQETDEAHMTAPSILSTPCEFSTEDQWTYAVLGRF